MGGSIRVLCVLSRNSSTLTVLALTVLALALVAGVVPASGESESSRLDRSVIAARLKEAYPAFVASIEGNDVVFKDGSRLPFDDRKSKSFEEWLARPDIEDMFRLPYPEGAPATPPARNFDPGRARNAAFFEKIYGDCHEAQFARSLTMIDWLPKKTRQTLRVTTINGVAEKLKAVSAELDALPSRFDIFLVPSAGAFVCRDIAGSGQRSAHGYGIAIDIAVKHSAYWRWSLGEAGSEPRYWNEVPAEIVDIFEKHGFIWGGRWYHYDTMHFEFRPELLDAGK
jgi:hypothetical protein